MSSTPSRILVPIELGMTRAFLLQGERPILVDAGNAGDEEKILGALEQHGVAPTDLALIILTHGHIDHFGSAAALQAASGAPLAVGTDDCALVRMTADPDYKPGTFLGRLLIATGMTRPADNQTPASPDWCIGGEFSLEYLGIPGRVIPTPGHTAGSLSITLDNGEIIVGDMLMSFVGKRPGKPIFLADPDAWQESLRRVMALKPRVLYAGHGGPFEPAQVLRAFTWTSAS